jgi:hypothetical protein
MMASTDGTSLQQCHVFVAYCSQRRFCVLYTASGHVCTSLHHPFTIYPLIRGSTHICSNAWMHACIIADETLLPATSQACALLLPQSHVCLTVSFMTDVADQHSGCAH